MESGLRILRVADRVPAPWKNGGGVTTEIAAFPKGASLDAFGWRVSIAEVAQGGPFSLFPGIDRILTVLKGRMLLEIAELGAADLSAKGCVNFPGDVATHATLVEGPVTDLNVMTRRGAFTARTEWLRAGETIALSRDATTILVFPFAPATLCDRKIPLAAGDALLIEAGARKSIGISPGVEYYHVEIASALPQRKARNP